VITRANGLLTDESRKNLSLLLGQNVFGLHMESVFIRPDSCYVEFFDFSFALHDTKKFVIVRPFWEDHYPEDRESAWLEITVEDTYENIAFDHLRRTTASSSIISLTPASPIHRITLLSKNLNTSDASSEGSWPYHYGLIVEHKERFKYLIYYQPEAFCRLQFTFNEDEIEYVRKNAQITEVLENIK
jgi:hypothetical protein